MTVSIVVDANHHNHQGRKRRHEDLKDIYRVMLKQEATTYNTVVRSTSSSISTTMEDKILLWRPTMISWMYSLVDKFDLRPQIVGTAMYYIDSSYHTTLLASTSIPSSSSSSSSKLQQRRRLLLLGITSLHLAMKIHELKLFSIQDLIKIGNNSNLGNNFHKPFEVKDVIDMERRLLEHMNFYLHPPPTAECFVLAFGELLPTSELFQKDALGLVRVGMMALSMELKSCISYSTLAYASLLLAMADVGAEELMEHFEYNMETVAGMKPQTFELAKACEVLARHSTITTTSSVASAVAAAGQNDGTSSTTTITDRRPLTSPPGAPPPQPLRTAPSYVPSPSSPKSTAVDLATKAIAIIYETQQGFVVVIIITTILW